jgi:uncharacterized protein YbjT (DUF2867 family)
MVRAWRVDSRGRLRGTVIFVAGATGTIGREVVAALVAAAAPVRALVREGRQDALPAGAQAVLGDLNDPGTFAAGLGELDGAFLLSGYERQEETLVALRDAGARRVVLLSSGSVPGEPDNAVTRYHAESEAAVGRSGLAWTFLRPNSFMANTLRWLPQLQEGDVVRDAFGDVPVAVIDPADVAAVAVTALVEGGHDGEALRLSGPEALLPADRLRILGEALGRDLRFVALDDDEARTEMGGAMPEPYVDAFFRFFRGGTVDETTVRPTVEHVLGRPPGTFRAWVAAHVEAFRT